MSRRIDLRIEHLVLEGVTVGDRAAYAAALRHAIAQRLAEPEAMKALGDRSVARIDAGRVARVADAGAVGTAVARAITRAQPR